MPTCFPCREVLHYVYKVEERTALRHNRPMIVIMLKRPDVIERFEGQSKMMKNILRRDPCSYCPKPGRSGTVDHIFPKCENPGTGWENLTGACPHCNSHKSDQRWWIFMMKNKQAAMMFNG